MITIDGLSKTYRGVRILAEVSATFRPGEVTFILGGNGAGKTTLFKCVLGLERYAGAVSFGSQPLEFVRDQVYPIFDDCPFFDHLSGYDNLRLRLGRTLERSVLQRAADGILENRLLAAKVGDYSLGQRKRLAVLGMILSSARFILADELASGLDVEAQDWLKERLREAAAHATVLVTGHQLDFYTAVADAVFVLHRTRLEKADHAADLETIYRDRILGAGT
jgi:ABC-type multidrug transport system ATPase subunit